MFEFGSHRAVDVLHRPLNGQLLAYWQPLAGAHVSVVQGTESLQSRGGPEHTPLAQTSFTVQALPSVQGAVLNGW